MFDTRWPWARPALDRGPPQLVRIGAWWEGRTWVVLPKSPIIAASGYASSSWVALGRSIEARLLSIKDNASGQAMEPDALCRKNWRFAGSEGGGRTAVVLLCRKPLVAQSLYYA